MNYPQALAFLETLPGAEKIGKFHQNLNPIKKLLKKLGNPEKSLKVIHIAGTVGKGSVAMMVSSILREAGFKVGTYTSPHVWDFRERYLLNLKKISKQDFAAVLTGTKPFIRGQSYFEVITAAAFRYFKEKNVDFLVCEVGMGGRLDATNIITPLVSVITAIGLEHTHVLGNSLPKIAREKAGIIKQNVPVIAGAAGNALLEIRKIAAKRNAPVITVYKPLQKYTLGLKGEFQKMNAAIAVESAKVLNTKYRFPISKASIKSGLRKSFNPGRLCFIKKNVLVDCAHNPDGMEALAVELTKLKRSYNKIILVIGILKDKDKKKMLDIITPLADTIILTKPNIPRAEDPRKLQKCLKKEMMMKNYIAPTVKSAVALAKKIAGKKDLIVVAGSMYVAGELQ
ncbi:bifunctional folylpolyglutamate synthase/dihydrofolate synthase [Candidatus Woesearchaeota archaeon]|nr:bifunctional folylpolyglutamate synthase/dihydrofolate synthase [Candidatus Woesearchaeota archaeon]